MNHYRSCDAPGIADHYIVPSDSRSLALIRRIFAHVMNFGKYAKSRGARAEIRTIVCINGIDILKKYIGKIYIKTITKRRDLNIETGTFVYQTRGRGFSLHLCYYSQT